MKEDFKAIKSPLQMAGFYLAWIETALAAGLWPLKEHDNLLIFLLAAVVGIAVLFALGALFILVYLARFNPRWLYNPADYDPSVQDDLISCQQSFSSVTSKGGMSIQSLGPGEVKGDA